MEKDLKKNLLIQSLYKNVSKNNLIPLSDDEFLIFKEIVKNAVDSYLNKFTNCNNETSQS